MANFEKSFEQVLINEGAPTNDPDDRGGETKYGISKASHPDIDIQSLTIKEAAKIYYEEYWEGMRLDGVESDEVADKIFNIGVNIGTRKMSRLVQICCCACGMYVQIDGRIGGKTLRAINNIRSDTMLCCLKAICAEYYISLNNKKYEDGWLRRAFQ